MRWEALFADMEAQLDAARTADLAAEVVELTRAERATVAVADRLRAARGAALTVRTDGGEQVSGILRDASAQWILLDAQGRSSLVPIGAVTAIRGLTPHSAGEGGVVERRLTLGHALRALARDRVIVQIVTHGGELTGRVERVGAVKEQRRPRIAFRDFEVVGAVEPLAAKAEREVLHAPREGGGAVVPGKAEGVVIRPRVGVGGFLQFEFQLDFHHGPVPPHARGLLERRHHGAVLLVDDVALGDDLAQGCLQISRKTGPGKSGGYRSTASFSSVSRLAERIEQPGERYPAFTRQGL